MNEITADLLRTVSDFNGEFKGAYNIRENSECAGRRSTENISLESMTERPGLIIRVKPGTAGETVYIPACVTKAGVDDRVFNDFYIGEGADVIVVAGCGIHTDNEGEAKHNGTHAFHIEKGAKVTYLEKHIGTGSDKGHRLINPVTEAYLAANASLTMETVQLGGVFHTERKTKVTLGENARLVIRERLLTDGDETADTGFEVYLEGDDSGADVISRSVARGNSVQRYSSLIVGKARCTGHTECDAIIAGNARVDAAPCLSALHADASLIHEAAIGKIAGEQIVKLCTLGLTEKEAEEKIIEGFLK